MIEFLQGTLVIASFFGVVYAPATLLDAVFGLRHFTWRRFALSCVLSLLFTFLSLGLITTYLINLPDYFDRREEQVRDLKQALDEAFPPILALTNAVISAMNCELVGEDLARLASARPDRIVIRNDLKCAAFFREYWRSQSLG